MSVCNRPQGLRMLYYWEITYVRVQVCLSFMGEVICIHRMLILGKRRMNIVYASTKFNAVHVVYIVQVHVHVHVCALLTCVHV